MSGKRLLIVEDERHIQLTLELYMTSRGFEVEVADNGVQAWKLIMENSAVEYGYDLILTDLRMPGMTGVELLERLRKDGSSVPVVVMTGCGDENSFNRLRNLGCFRIVSKPFSPARIENVIIEALACASKESGGSSGSIRTNSESIL